MILELHVLCVYHDHWTYQIEIEFNVYGIL
jgi:hypothetical protein